jgi:hypothetical protein
MRPCEFCGEPIFPNPRVGARQRSCGSEACQKARHAANCREWNQAHPVSATTAAAKARAFREAHPDYWRERRREKDLRERELALQRERRRRAKESRDGKRDSIVPPQVLAKQALEAAGIGVSKEIRDVNRDSIPSEVLVFLGLLLSGTRADDGKCDSMDPDIAFWESRGRRFLERFASLRRA